MEVLRIAMWSGPRNISTALMRAFENRPDCAVVDEPFYGHYLETTGLEHPEGDAIMASMSCDWREVARQLLEDLPATADPASCRVFYQKHMTQHILPHMRMDWTAGLTNCFLIREPRRIIASYAKVRPRFAVEELGFPQQWKLFQRVADRLGAAGDRFRAHPGKSGAGAAGALPAPGHRLHPAHAALARRSSRQRRRMGAPLVCGGGAFHRLPAGQ